MKRWLIVAAAAAAFAVHAAAQSASLSVSPTTYSGSGGQVTVTATVNYGGGSPSAIGLQVNLPNGWAFVSQSLPGGATASAAPSAGDSTLSWAFSGFPATQLQWSFVVSYPSAMTGDQTIAIDSSQSAYRPGPVALSGSTTVHQPPAPQITSAGSANAAAGQTFSYTISASNSPTSYTASGLPSWLSINGATISGTAPSSGSSTFTVGASSPYGSDSKTVTVTIGDVPSITSSTSASGKVGESFSYTITASNGASSFAASGLPSGLAVSGATISGTPTQGGTFHVGLTASNSFGGGSATLDLTIAAGNAPHITTQPGNQSATIGGGATFTVTATGATSYQWRKDGNNISGATGATLTLNNLATTDAGKYTVVVSNVAGSVTSDEATLTVNPPNSGAAIATQPVSQTVAAGTKCVLSVAASGTAPLSYQWRRNGSAVSGATSDTLTINHTWNDNAGDYSVTVTNAFGAVTSNIATVAVKNVEYFGTLGANGGSFALYVRGDRTGVFLAYAKSSKVALATKDLVFDTEGRFSVKTKTTSAQQALWANARINATPSEWENGPSAAIAATNEYVIDGAIGDDGTLSGSISGLGLSLSAPAPSLTGSTSSAAGFYQSGAVGSSAVSYTIISPNGDAFVATVTPTGTDAGQGTVDSSGNVAVTTDTNVVVSGTVNAGTSIQITATKDGTSPMSFSGGTTDTHAERLINISTRAIAGAGDATLIAGFAISGNQPKQVLIRGIGPGLAAFGVGGTIANPQIKVYQGKTIVAQNSSWSSSPDAAAIAAAANKVGAFPLPAGSKDAVLLINLQPNIYSAQLTTTDGATGVGMIEVYEVP